MTCRTGTCSFPVSFFHLYAARPSLSPGLVEVKIPKKGVEKNQGEQLVLSMGHRGRVPLCAGTGLILRQKYCRGLSVAA